MIFYGETPTGKRIHLGNWKSPRTGGRTDWVYTFCGAEMRSWEEGDRPPASRADEFCKNCFRKYAWRLMLQVLQEDTLPIYGAVKPDQVYTKVVAPDPIHRHYDGIPEGEK